MSIEEQWAAGHTFFHHLKEMWPGPVHIQQYSITGGKVKNNRSLLGASTVTKKANKPPASMDMKANMPRVCVTSSRDLQKEKEGVGAAGVGNFPSLNHTEATLCHSVRDSASRQASMRKPTGFSKRARTDQSNHPLKITGCLQGAHREEQFVQRGGGGGIST